MKQIKTFALDNLENRKARYEFKSSWDVVKSKSETILHVGEIVGWRAWRFSDTSLENIEDKNFVNAEKEKIYIRSLFYDSLWLPGQTVEARWVPIDFNNSLFLPGIHAWKSQELAEKYLQKLGLSGWGGVIGEVEVWGTVIDHKDCMRAQYAAVKSLKLWDERILNGGYYNLEREPINWGATRERMEEIFQHVKEKYERE